jgi:hypothetical protein
MAKRTNVGPEDDQERVPVVSAKGVLINDDWVRHDYYKDGQFSHSIAMPTKPVFSEEAMTRAASED